MKFFHMVASQLAVLCSLISQISADPQFITEEEQLYITEGGCDFSDVLKFHVGVSNIYCFCDLHTDSWRASNTSISEFHFYHPFFLNY